MQIMTKDFGELEISQDSIITFPKGIMAFEEIKDYVLLNYELDIENSPIKCLQSISGNVSFTVVDPFCFLPDYAPVLNKADKKLLAVDDDKDLRFLVIAVIGETMAETVVNLRSPIVINTVNRRAMQVILEGDQYPLKYHLFVTDVDKDGEVAEQC